ncbi:hypothetical protein ACIBQX_40290 [Nonomuraea sp. NPDC049714]|uniref:hypothetical protein n=1 Tax=Nonomuraea sp. NPDC049714 TaxID=3364357 RepID=UPI0037A50047
MPGIPTSTCAGSGSTKLKQYEIENSPENWRKVAAAVAATKQKLNDPAYAAALLSALGPDKFRALFMQWMKNKGPAMDKGVPPDTLKEGKEALGPLAEAYANAERAGRLGKEWGEEFIKTTQPGVLTALVAISKPSTRLLNQVALRVLSRPLGADLPTSQNCYGEAARMPDCRRGTGVDGRAVSPDLSCRCCPSEAGADPPALLLSRIWYSPMAMLLKTPMMPTVWLRIPRYLAFGLLGSIRTFHPNVELPSAIAATRSATAATHHNFRLFPTTSSSRHAR